MVQTTKKLQLTNPMIAEFLQELGEHTKKLRIERKNALRISLTVEELLLRWQEHCGKETFVTVTTKKRAGALSISISLQGEPWNPLFVEGDDTEYRTRLLDRLGLSLVYTYRRGTNYVTLRLTKQRDNSVVALLVAILAAMLIGIPCTLFAPSFASAVLAQVLIPVRTTMLNVLTAVAVPVVFLSVIQGIVGVGDIASFGKIGKRLMLRFVLKIVAFTGLRH